MASVALASSPSAPTVSTEEDSGTSTTSTLTAMSARIERPTREDTGNLATFLIDHFVKSEPILASLEITNRRELTMLMEDLLKDCVGCGATVIARDIESRAVVGACLASKHQLFDQQMDRLCRYSFTDEQLSIAIEFLKYVFNKADVAYHLEECKVAKPIFIALIAVTPELQQQGVGKRLLQASLQNARDMDRCDSAFTVCSSDPGRALLCKHFTEVISRIRYCDYRGEYREPPIKPSGSQVLHILLAKL